MDSGGPTLKTDFTYDILGDMTSSTPPGGNSCNTSYAYNADGDPSSLVRYRDNATEADNLSYNYQSGTRRLTSISNSVGTGSSCTYDADGNVASDSKANVAFTIYDPFNEAVEVWLTSGTEYKYGYGVNGTRILKNWGGSNWNFYMNDPDGKTIAINLEPYSQDQVYNVWAGNSNIGQARFTGSYSYYYYLKDHLGDIRMVLNQSGTVDSYNDYYAPGEMVLFDASNSHDNDLIDGGVALKWEWNFNYDGAFYRGTVETSTSPYMTTSFPGDGTYQVAVRFWDNDGQAGNVVVMTVTIGLGPTYYYLKDHLGSVRATIDEKGNRVGYDDYYPFGGTMPGRSSNSAIADAKYKFTGKERDVETGLDCSGARYYDIWRGQWASVDPMAEKYPG